MNEPLPEENEARTLGGDIPGKDQALARFCGLAPEELVAALENFSEIELMAEAAKSRARRRREALQRESEGMAAVAGE